LSIIQRLEQLEKARQVQETQRIAALDRLLEALTPEEAMTLEAALEADLAGWPVPSHVEQQADMVFARAWAEATPEDRALLANGTIAEAW
jgi:hypothetical protein